MRAGGQGAARDRRASRSPRADGPGRWSIRYARLSWMAAARTACRSSRTRRMSCGRRANSFRRGASATSRRDVDASCASVPSPISDATLRSAATTYVQNVTGSSSVSSSDSQATRPSVSGRSANHAASSVDFPNPAGAERSVSFEAPIRARRSRSRGRATSARCGRGTCSFVSSSWPVSTRDPRDTGQRRGWVRGKSRRSRAWCRAYAAGAGRWKDWSRRWDSNPRPSVYETDALPLSYFGPDACERG